MAENEGEVLQLSEENCCLVGKMCSDILLDIRFINLHYKLFLQSVTLLLFKSLEHLLNHQPLPAFADLSKEETKTTQTEQKQRKFPEKEQRVTNESLQIFYPLPPSCAAFRAHFLLSYSCVSPGSKPILTSWPGDVLFKWLKNLVPFFFIFVG
jgi:hypothetical protein